MSPLQKIQEELVPSSEKGMPPGPPVVLGDIGRQGWHMLREDMSFPLAIIRKSALLHNALWMQRFARDQDVWLYPHGKTTMSPQIFSLQLEHGCKGITAANPIQAEICLQHGVESVFIANQVTGRQSLRRLVDLCDEYPRASFFLIVDSVHNASELASCLRGPIAAGQLALLIEIGAPGGRTGLRNADEACELARVLQELGIPASGLEAYEGIFNMADFGKATAQVEALLEQIGDCYRTMDSHELFAPGTAYLSAGGSAFYDLVAQRLRTLSDARALQVIIRSGCSISHDHGMYQRAYRDMLARGLIAPLDHLQPALEVWAQVQSQPEPGLAFANAGKRDLSYDIELPLVRWWFRPGVHSEPQAIDQSIRVTGLNDQHAYLHFEQEADLRVGDLLGFGISHPCTTFDKWKYLFLVDDDYGISGAIKTFF